MALKPILLLADSQNLFWSFGGQGLLKRLFKNNAPKTAVYIGAANDDRPEFYQIFQAAMQQTGVKRIEQIFKEFPQHDAQLLDQADLILLAGGDVRRGWEILRQTGMARRIVDRYYAGAFLIGVSAGSVHLGLMFRDENRQLVETLKLVPFIVDVHRENESWQTLKDTLSLSNNKYIHGLGIPLGSGILYREDHSIEAIRKPAWLFEQSDAGIKQELLLPKEFAEVKAGEES